MTNIWSNAIGLKLLTCTAKDPCSSRKKYGHHLATVQRTSGYYVRVPRLNVYSSFSDKKIATVQPYSADVPVFVGLSLTTMPYSDAKSRRSSQVAIRVAGSDTIINTEKQSGGHPG
eukprot:gene895-1402_t